MPFRPGPASVPPGRARPDSDGVFRHGGSNRHMDRGASAGIGTGRIHASSFCRGAELPFDRKRQRAPLLLRCGIPSKNREACRSQRGPVVTRQGSISRGRNPDRRKAEEYLPRLLSDTDRGVLLNVVLQFRGPSNDERKCERWPSGPTTKACHSPGRRSIGRQGRQFREFQGPIDEETAAA